jgi:hypothetical protein
MYKKHKYTNLYDEGDLSVRTLNKKFSCGYELNNNQTTLNKLKRIILLNYNSKSC